MADFYSNPSPFLFSTAIDIPTSCFSLMTATVTIECGETGPFTYQWYFSQNGIDYFLISRGTSNTANVIPSSYSKHTDFYRVSVTDVNGYNETANVNFQVPACVNGTHSRLENLENDKINLTEPIISITPDPNNGFFSLSLPESKENFTFEIYNIFGQQMVINNYSADDPTHFKFSINQCSSGYYILEAKSANNNFRLPFIVNQ